MIHVHSRLFDMIFNPMWLQTDDSIEGPLAAVYAVRDHVHKGVRLVEPWQSRMMIRGSGAPTEFYVNEDGMLSCGFVGMHLTGDATT